MTALLIVVALAALAGAHATRRPVVELALLATALLAALSIDATDPHPVALSFAAVAAALWAWRVTGWAVRCEETAP